MFNSLVNVYVAFSWHCVINDSDSAAGDQPVVLYNIHNWSFNIDDQHWISIAYIPMVYKKIDFP